MGTHVVAQSSTAVPHADAAVIPHDVEDALAGGGGFGITRRTVYLGFGEGEPYLLDAWTGEITPIAQYQRRGNRVDVELKLPGDEAVIVACSPPIGGRRRDHPTRVHLVGSSASNDDSTLTKSA